MTLLERGRWVDAAGEADVEFLKGKEAPWVLVTVFSCQKAACHGHPKLTVRSDN